jgi:hypothetical protein
MALNCRWSSGSLGRVIVIYLKCSKQSVLAVLWNTLYTSVLKIYVELNSSGSMEPAVYRVCSDSLSWLMFSGREYGDNETGAKKGCGTDYRLPVVPEMASERPATSGLYDYSSEPRHSPPVSSGSFTSGEGLSGREEGYDYEFIIRDEKYDCPICLLVLREPQQTTCGHRFCKNCIHKWLK